MGLPGVWAGVCNAPSWLPREKRCEKRCEDAADTELAKSDVIQTGHIWFFQLAVCFWVLGLPLFLHCTFCYICICWYICWTIIFHQPRLKNYRSCWGHEPNSSYINPQAFKYFKDNRRSNILHLKISAWTISEIRFGWFMTWQVSV